MQAHYFSMRNKKGQLVTCHLLGQADTIKARLEKVGYTQVTSAPLVYLGV